MPEGEDDYAVKAAREWNDLIVVHPGCDICNNHTSCEVPPECGCADEHEEQCIAALATIIRKYASEEMAKREYELEQSHDEQRYVEEAGEEM